jgi:hypothetical protein
VAADRAAEGPARGELAAAPAACARGWTRFVARAARRHGAQLIHSHWGDHACRDVDAARKAGLVHVATFYG